MSKINKCGLIFHCNGISNCRFFKNTIVGKFCDYQVADSPYTGCACDEARIERLQKIINEIIANK